MIAWLTQDGFHSEVEEDDKRMMGEDGSRNSTWPQWACSHGVLAPVSARKSSVFASHVEIHRWL